MNEYKSKEKGKEESKDENGNFKKMADEVAFFVIGSRPVEVAPGLFLNRSQETAGEVWIARIKHPRILHVLGAVPGDPREGLPALTQVQAISRAKRWRKRAGGGKPLHLTDRTVAHAVETYLAASIGSTNIKKKRLSRLANEIIRSLGGCRLDKLHPGLLMMWAESMWRGPFRGDMSHGVRIQAVGPDIPLSRRSRWFLHRANRIITLLKAALDLAYVNGWVVDDAAWRYLRQFEVPCSGLRPKEDLAHHATADLIRSLLNDPVLMAGIDISRQPDSGVQP